MISICKKNFFKHTELQPIPLTVYKKYFKKDCRPKNKTSRNYKTSRRKHGRKIYVKLN